MKNSFVHVSHVLVLEFKSVGAVRINFGASMPDQISQGFPLTLPDPLRLFSTENTHFENNFA